MIDYCDVWSLCKCLLFFFLDYLDPLEGDRYFNSNADIPNLSERRQHLASND